MHIILALRWPDGAAGITLGGGITFEYYPSTNCGLLTYLIVHRSSRGQGLASVLVERAVHLLQQTARRRGHLAGCNAILLETNSAGMLVLELRPNSSLPIIRPVMIVLLFVLFMIRFYRKGDGATGCDGSSYATYYLP